VKNQTPGQTVENETVIEVLEHRDHAIRGKQLASLLEDLALQASGSGVGRGDKVMQCPVEDHEIEGSLLEDARQVLRRAQDELLAWVTGILGEEASSAVQNSPGGVRVPLKQPVCEVAVSSSYIEEGKCSSGKTRVESWFNQLPLAFANIFDVEVFELVFLKLLRLGNVVARSFPPRRGVASLRSCCVGNPFSGQTPGSNSHRHPPNR